MFERSKKKVGDIIELEPSSDVAHVTPQANSSAVASSVKPPAPEGSSSISSGLSIVGNIVGKGKLAIYGRVEGEVRASAVHIGDGAEVAGNIVADELTVGGRVKGTIRANRVKLNGTAVVEGDIHHRTLAMEENAQFEGMSRRQDSAVDVSSLAPANLSPAQPPATNGSGHPPI